MKSNVDLMLNYIKEISCNNDEVMFQAYMKYYSQLCRGKKTDVIIYKRSMEGTGKSTETSFMMKHVLGPDVCLVSSTEPLLTPYNKIYAGKVLVVFEELPTFSESQL